MISIHALTFRRTTKLFYFYPRPPRGGRLSGVGSYCFTTAFLSTPSARRATDLRYFYCGEYGISIHALREEGDDQVNGSQLAHNHFYPRPPRGGRPLTRIPAFTPIYFYPRPPRGGRRGRPPEVQGREPISIHALREEGDLGQESLDVAMTAFLSTPSARRATQEPRQRQHHSAISIHALREEGDPFRCHLQRLFSDFYPRPPRGGRPAGQV